MLTIIVSPAGRGNFVAYLDGRQLCIATRSPFLAAARRLLSEGADPDTKIIMRHAGSETDCLIGTVGEAAELCVLEDRRPTRFGRRRTATENQKDVPQTCVNAPLHALNDVWGTSSSVRRKKIAVRRGNSKTLRMTKRIVDLKMLAVVKLKCAVLNGVRDPVFRQ